MGHCASDDWETRMPAQGAAISGTLNGIVRRPWGAGIDIECPACHGTGQDDPPPEYYHGKCQACGGGGRLERLVGRREDGV